KELEDLTISCEAYNLFYKDVVEEAASYNAVGGSISDTSGVYASLDEAFGKYIKTWVNNQGQPTDIEGNVFGDSVLQFYYSTVVCEEKSVTEKIADTLHDGTIAWITKVRKESYLDTIREAGYNGVIGVNCSATCEQDVWIDLDDCGYGTITRRFFIQGGCGPHATPPQEVEQVIYVEPACEVRLSMFDLPSDIGTKTEALCVASEVTVNNLPTSLTGDATLLPHLEGALCNAVAIGHEDKVSRILDASGMYKVERTWEFIDWCDQDSRITHVQEIIVQVDPECTEPDVVSRGPDPMDDFEVGNREIGDGFKLHQNRPNPFDGYTVIGFDLPEDTDARLTIYDVTGKVLKEFEGEYKKGYNEVQVAQHELPITGVMYYQLDTDKYTATKRMVKVE
ncbi:T9SS type A sorting domain-containing protein, partial [Membranihabitans maritimus]|uniref:T9SS type A sorting domain-containing protein n=1 Tax=Membranihabitans maritimus TaxID=2904244 RepID=UPI001F2539D3